MKSTLALRFLLTFALAAVPVMSALADDPAASTATPEIAPDAATAVVREPQDALPPLTNSFGDLNVLRTHRFGLELGGMAQVMGMGEDVPDPYKNPVRFYLFLKEARLRTTAHYEDYTLNFELALGGEDSVAAPNPGVALSLLDLNADLPLHFLGSSYLKIGQQKVPYGREGLTYSGFTQFVGKSIDYLGFVVGRDVGLSLNLKAKNASLVAGVFTGGGRDVPQEFLPEKFGSPLLVLRTGFGNVDDDLYVLKQNDLENKTTKMALYLNGLIMKDSLIGHSSVMNVKLADKSLLLNGNWNPYIGKSPFSQGLWSQAGFDGALRSPLAENIGIAAEIEGNYGNYANDYGSVQVFGLRAQASIMVSHFEAAIRYAVLLPSHNFADGAKGITAAQAITEVTPALSYYIYGHSLKVVADLPILIQTPVFYEKNVGTYVGTDMPNQATVLAAGGNVERQNVLEGRLMLQGAF